MSVTHQDGPRVGQLVTVRGVPCQITKILPMGTVEVEALDGHIAFWVSGLPMVRS